MQRRRFMQTALGAAAMAALPTSAALAQAVRTLSKVDGAVEAIGLDGRKLTLEHAALEELRDSLQGRLLLPGHEGYDDARRVVNAGIDKYPALVVQPTGASDVMRAVEFARQRDLLLAVKCGGHSYGGKSTCDGGLQIDLSTLRGTHVDARTRRAHVAGGSLLASLDHEAMAQGLVTTAGTVSHTGVGGLTLGGGFGRLARRFGLALDNVTAVDIVTADGKLLHANAEEHPDLYWGVRGGGGNFGVVTRFEFQLHPMKRTVVGGDLLFPLSQLRDIARFYADYSRQAPDELYLDLIASSRSASRMASLACMSVTPAPRRRRRPSSRRCTKPASLSGTASSGATTSPSSASMTTQTRGTTPSISSPASSTNSRMRWSK